MIGERGALLSPDIGVLGDLAQEAEALALWFGGPGAEGIGAETPAPLVRRLLLAELAQAAGAPDGEPMSPDAATRLAAALERLLDEAQIAGVDPAKLATLNVEDSADHWRRALAFLRILFDAWPKLRAERGFADPAERRNAALDALIAQWRETPPDQPVIAAGTTGSQPAVARLLRAILDLPQGAVILPGFDFGLGDEDWDAIRRAPTHPQHGLIALLDRLEIAPEAVRRWPEDAPDHPRSALLRAALAPVGRPMTPPAAAVAAAALDGLRVLDCPHPQAEAETAAVLLRGALEDPGRTAALVTPDRELARRVAAALGRWGLAADDSAGRPLTVTPVGAFLRLTARVAAEQAAPSALLALLKHPLARVPGDPDKPAQFRDHARALEKLALRGLRPPPGLAGVTRRLEDALAEKDRPDLRAWWSALSDLAEPFFAMAREAHPARDLLAGHIALCEALAGGSQRLWREADGEAAAQFAADLHDAAGRWRMNGVQWAGFFEQLMAARAVRPALAGHPRLRILGLLEARMVDTDLRVLAGLNEGSWPEAPPPDPWLSRGMRKELGLDSPETLIGRQAHDFQQAACAGEVVILRAAKAGGAPTTPARWLDRIDTALKAGGAARPDEDRHAAEAPVRWAAALDARIEPTHRQPDAARPPPEARPRLLSVSAFEKLMRTPYQVYASHVLGLRALDPLDAEPGPMERGNVLHQIMERFLQSLDGREPGDLRALLMRLGDEAFARFADEPVVTALWRPRFERIAEGVLAVERARMPSRLRSFTEIAGSTALETPHGVLTIRAKADRIDQRRDGRDEIIDYKSGERPEMSKVRAGLRPQMPLEALIHRRGGFADLRGDGPDLAYWSLKPEAAGDGPAPVAGDEDWATVAEEAVIRLAALFADPDWGFAAVPRAGCETDPGWAEVAPLARLAPALTPW